MEYLQIANILPTILLFFQWLTTSNQAQLLTNDVTVISNWAFQWKMIFNPHLTKQVQEVIFSRKTKKLLHHCLSFNDNPLMNNISKKHLGLTLDVKLNFVEHIKNITQKISKTMGLLRRFQPILPRSSLLAMYKTFIRSQLDFVGVICDQANNFPFHEKLESVQYNPWRNNRSNKWNIIRKTMPKVRVRTSKIETLV